MVEPGMGTFDTTCGDVRLEVQMDAVVTPQAEDIVTHHAPQMLNLFLQKNRKYAKVGNDLGERGVFPDVYRKMGILRDRIWDDNEVVGESTEEVIQDLIGHLFLMLHMMSVQPPEFD